jgi:hypothetical protein
LQNTGWFSSETAEVQPQPDDIPSLPWAGDATATSHDHDATDTTTTDAAHFAAESSAFSLLLDATASPPPPPSAAEPIVARTRNDTFGRQVLPQLRAPWNLDRIDQKFLPLDTGCAGYL